MPVSVLFAAHGSPLLAIEDSPYARFLDELGQSRRPRAIALLSAHWTRRGPAVTSALEHRLLYDFAGFPPALYNVRYPARGDRELLEALGDCLGGDLHQDPTRGLDHGAWVLLRRLFPAADVPVAELSVDPWASPAEQLALGRRLAPLARDGVQILASGGTVHNLGAVDWRRPDARAPWAEEFDAWLADRLRAWDLEAVAAYRERAPGADLAVPQAGTEHFAPLLYALGAADATGQREAVRHIQTYEMGSLSLAVWEFRAASGSA
jgi:4,5-DOPA dioxygenase extradiol